MFYIFPFSCLFKKDLNSSLNSLRLSTEISLKEKVCQQRIFMRMGFTKLPLLGTIPPLIPPRRKRLSFQCFHWTLFSYNFCIIMTCLHKSHTHTQTQCLSRVSQRLESRPVHLYLPNYLPWFLALVAWKDGNHKTGKGYNSVFLTFFLLKTSIQRSFSYSYSSFFSSNICPPKIKEREREKHLI